MENTYLEKIFYHYIDKRPEIEQFVLSKFFENPAIRTAYEVRSEFRKKFMTAPTLGQMKQLVKVKGFSERLTNDELDAIYDDESDLNQYDDDWLDSTTEAWIEYKNLDVSIVDLVTYMKMTKITPENIKEVVQTAKNIIVDHNAIDFKFNEGLDFFNPESHRQDTELRFSTGYSYLDKVMNGGYSPKTLMAFAGMPKVGKSMWLCNLACNGIRQGYNVVYVSFEMSEKKVIKRLACNLLNVPSKEYEIISGDVSNIKRKFSNVTTNMFTVPGKLWVKEFPTSSVSVPDMEMWLKKMEEMKKIKFKLVIVDYVGIMKNFRNPNTENLYLKIKQISEDLRASAMRNDWCIVTASQFNRGAYNSTDVVLEQIAESSALIHTVDGLFGIIQDDAMLMNSEYFLKTLANRDEGYKNSKKRFTISYDYMRIVEDESSDIIN